MARLKSADVIIASASRWGEDPLLLRQLDRDRAPESALRATVGTIGTILLSEVGRVTLPGYKGVGMDFDGLKKVASSGGVMLMCGGEERRAVALSALRANLISVIFTTQPTADWLLQRSTPHGTRKKKPRIPARGT
jgi:hypothetical protein